MVGLDSAPYLGGFAGAITGLASFNLTRQDEIAYQFDYQKKRNARQGGGNDIAYVLGRSGAIGGAIFSGMVLGAGSVGTAAGPFAAYFALHAGGTYAGMKLGRLVGKYQSWKAKRKGVDLVQEIMKKRQEKMERMNRRRVEPEAGSVDEVPMATPVAV